MSTPDFDTRVAQYVKLRDKIKELETANKETLKPYKEALEKLNGILLSHLNQINADSVSSSSGNVHRQVKKSASAPDKEAFWTFVVTQEMWEMLDYKPNVTAVEDFIKEQGAPPPGVNFTTRYEVGVLRASTKKD
jgi:hypothetical protein